MKFPVGKNKIINCTSRRVNYLSSEVLVYDPSGITPKMIFSSGNTVFANDTIIVKPTIKGLPPEQKGVYLIVDVPIKLACPERQDLIVQYDLIKDSNDQVIGCRRFLR